MHRDDCGRLAALCARRSLDVDRRRLVLAVELLLGWAPFHYGRWYRSHRGWAWVPGTRWAPAWVHWRECSTHYGWAPLPPSAHYHVAHAHTAHTGFHFRGRPAGLSCSFGLTEVDYCFVRCEHFLQPRLAPMLCHRDRVRGMYHRTRIVNHAYVYNHNRIMHRGLHRVHVCKHTRRDLHPVRLQDRHLHAGEELIRNGSHGGNYTVYRPKLENKATETPPQVLERLEKRKERLRALREQRQ